MNAWLEILVPLAQSSQKRRFACAGRPKDFYYCWFHNSCGIRQVVIGCAVHLLDLIEENADIVPSLLKVTPRSPKTTWREALAPLGPNRSSWRNQRRAVP